MIVANTAIENLSEQNAELNQELEVLDDELLNARNFIKALKIRCSGVVLQMTNKSTEMSDKVKLSVPLSLHICGPPIEKTTTWCEVGCQMSN